MGVNAIGQRQIVSEMAAVCDPTDQLGVRVVSGIVGCRKDSVGLYWWYSGDLVSGGRVQQRHRW